MVQSSVPDSASSVNNLLPYRVNYSKSTLFSVPGSTRLRGIEDQGTSRTSSRVDNLCPRESGYGVHSFSCPSSLSFQTPFLDSRSETSPNPFHSDSTRD